MRISFYGAAGEVTGSCYLVETGASRILVDCGMFQGSRFADERNHAAFPFDAATIEAVLVTHAHLDHTGRLPKLAAAGFRGRIITTAPTAALAKLILEDAVEVMQYEAEKNQGVALYQAVDVERVVSAFSPVAYGARVAVGPGVEAVFHDAGHILGSAFIELRAEGKSIIFSGDLGNREVPIVRDPEVLPTCDVLVMESTYGGHVHEDTQTRVKKLRAVIMETVKVGGVLLIPAFAIERIQEILYELHGLVQQKLLPPVPIFLDSPLAIKATAVFRAATHFYDQEASARVGAGEELFRFPGLTMTVTREQSRMINEARGPKVIIAGAGMMTGGRILHHARRYLKDSRSAILFVGYQAQRTLGRRILDGADYVFIYDERVPVRARVEKIGGYSAHADRTQLLAWVQSAPRRPDRIFLVHGEDESRRMIGMDLQSALGIVPEKPELGASLAVT